MEQVAKTLGANTSQKGKLSSFRNEKYNGENVSLGGAWFTACPEAGTIQCDFVSTSRPKQVGWGIVIGWYEEGE